MSTKDIQKWRRDTPGTQGVYKVHLDERSKHTNAHLNNAGASLMTSDTIDAMQDYLAVEQLLGGYEAADAYSETLAAFYTQAATLIGASHHEIAFKESATDAAQAVLLSLDLKEGDRVLVHASEYASNLIALAWLRERIGIEIDLISSSQNGEIDLAELRRKITSRTRVICVTHIASFEGTIQPAEAVGAIAQEHDLFYILDACQSLGQCPVNVEQIGCDALFGTGRKYLRGPRGSGLLYVRQSRLNELQPLPDLRGGMLVDQHIKYAEGAQRFERFEHSRAGKIGLSLAISYALNIGLPVINSRIETLAASLRGSLQSLPDVEVYEASLNHSGIVTFTGDFNPADAMLGLRKDRINVSVVQGPVGAPRLRASVHYFNTDTELARLVQSVARISST